MSSQIPNEHDRHPPAKERGGAGMGTFLTGVVSVLALVMSGFNLFQTVLKQPKLHLFVPETISYTRDANGSFEVLVVPVTIANSGARDGVVSSLELEVKNTTTGRERTFKATYVADQGYFSTAPEEKNGTVRARPRPKFAFAPIVVSGGSGFSGTLLFYPPKYSEERVVPKEGTYTLKLSAKTKIVEKLDAIDRALAGQIDPVSFTATLPKVSRYFPGQMLTGKFVRLFVEQKK